MTGIPAETCENIVNKIYYRILMCILLAMYVCMRVYCKENIQMETINKKTSKKAQVPMGRWCQEWFEKDETHKMGGTSSRSTYMEGYCWEGKKSIRVVAP